MTTEAPVQLKCRLKCGAKFRTEEARDKHEGSCMRRELRRLQHEVSEQAVLLDRAEAALRDAVTADAARSEVERLTAALRALIAALRALIDAAEAAYTHLPFLDDANIRKPLADAIIDDRSAVTLWLPKSQERREALAKTLERMAEMVRNARPETGLD